MIIRFLKECDEFTSADGCALRELLHAHKQKLGCGYSLAHAVLPASKTTKPHRLSSSEVYYIIRGEGRMHIDKESAAVGPGAAVYIPPSSVQYIENTGGSDLEFLCIVDPAWRKEDEEILCDEA